MFFRNTSNTSAALYLLLPVENSVALRQYQMKELERYLIYSCSLSFTVVSNAYFLFDNASHMTNMHSDKS